MLYHLSFMGKTLGVFSLEELRRRRNAGELTGRELVWCQGMESWQYLDLVLQSVAPKKKSRTLLVVGVALGCVVLIGAILFGVVFVKAFKAGFLRSLAASRQTSGVAAAGKPIVWNTNSPTQIDVSRKRKAFGIRHFLDGYREHGERTPSCDAAALRLIEAWIDVGSGVETSNTVAEVAQMADALAADPNCTDPIVLTVAALCSEEYFEKIHRFERALKSFETSKHKAYPRLYATVSLAGSLKEPKDQARVGQLDAIAIGLLQKALEDGSIQPEDQEHLADAFVRGWGEAFFNRKGRAIWLCVKEKEKSFNWLSLVLQGDCEINEAWKARGNGYADTVTSKGWEGFETHLQAARTSLTAAWELRPDLPLAASRMLSVALGDDSDSLRQWFDRAVAAQVDDPTAWNSMRWGLRPRWHGSLAAMKALGVAAIDTGRFDTDVPRKFFDVVYDLELEKGVLPGQHIYGEDDLWPEFQRMYEGYIAAPSEARNVKGWLSSYAIVAWFAGKYDVARKQLELLDWELTPGSCADWGADLSLMPLELAARTGALRSEIEQAEAVRDDDISKALAVYKKLSDAPAADARMRSFIQHRVASLQMEERLQSGEWVDFLPAATNDLNWTMARGNCTILPDGSVEVAFGRKGHSLICRARVGVEFEVSGDVEWVRSTNGNFQAGLVMGLPDPDNRDWYSFRLKRNDNEGEVVSLARGWTIGGHVASQSLLQDHNSFVFRFAHEGATATVNGKQVFQRVSKPGNIRVCDNQFLVGLGAYNDSNDTIVRYRNMKIRRIIRSSPASRE